MLNNPILLYLFFNMSFQNTSSNTLSAVIVSYNVRDYVLEGIESLYKHCVFPIQIILIDNNSDDQTVDFVKKKYPEVSIIENKKNVGFSAANNQGFKLCKGDYVLMFNPDALLINDSIIKMMDELKSNKNNNILIGPKLINTDDSLQVSCWKFPSLVQHILELFFFNGIIDTSKYSNSELNKPISVDFISGAFILMSKKTIDLLNGLDENLFWMDDVDLCKRNLELGGMNIFYPYATARHHIGKSSSKKQKIVISNQIISKLKFYKKHKQFFNYSISILIYFLQIITRIFLFFILSLFSKIYKSKLEAYVFSMSKFFKYILFNKHSLI